MSILPASPPRVALVGRTNVGKSSLWNRLTETGQALVSSEAHTTRDRKYGPVLWHGMMFELVDTGGLDVENDAIGSGMFQQTQSALRQADLILFVVDGHAGVLPQDQAIAAVLKKSYPHVWLVVNKVDVVQQLAEAHAAHWYRLGFGEPHVVSASTGLKVGDLLDEILLALDQGGKPAIATQPHHGLRLVLIGKPNVGKSSLMNAILGEQRVIVSDIAHTTREPQDTRFRYHDQDMILVDTAGMRKQSRVDSRIETASIELNRRAIEQADVAFLVFDATESPSAQDRHLAGLLKDSSCGLILVANKWDLVEEKTAGKSVTYERDIRQSFPFLAWAPMLFVSAKTGQRAHKLLDLAIDVQKERLRHIDYNAINRLMKGCIKSKRPLPSYGAKSPRIYDVAQLDHAPPKFLITAIGDKDTIHPNWLKFFEKRIREKFGFNGTPISVQARHVPAAKSEKKHNLNGPGLEAVAGSVKEKPRRVNQTRRRQKGR